MLTALVAALALWVPAPWAVAVQVVYHGGTARLNHRTETYMLHGHAVARLVPSRCRAGYAIRNLTHGQLIVRYIPS